MLSIILVAVLLYPTSISTSKIESKLINHLLSYYNPLVRPVSKSTDNVTVKIGVGLNQLIEVNEKQQVFTTIILLSSTWQDDSLIWNAAEFGNITQLRIPANRVWRPDIYLYNTADEEIFQSMQSRGSMNALIYSTGTVVFVPHLILKATCQMDVTWFPFDEQLCHLNFGSWTHSGKEMDLQPFVDTNGGLGSYLPHGEWKLLGVEHKIISKIYECCPNDPYLTIRFSIRIKRQSMYYFFNLMVPCALIGFLAILGFTLPPDSGEKLSLGVTVLFSLIVFLNQITDSMPANSNGVPLLGTYFNCVMFTIASSVVSTIVINLNIRSGKEPKAMGTGIENILLVWLPWILRMKREDTTEVAVLNKNTIEDVLKPVNKKASQRTAELATLTTEFTRESDNNGDKWLFGARVVDRLCLAGSVVFALISVTIFLISSLALH